MKGMNKLGLGLSKLYLNVDKFIADLDNDSCLYIEDGVRKLVKFLKDRPVEQVEVFSMTMDSKRKFSRWSRASRAILGDHGISIGPQAFDPREVLAGYLKNNYDLPIKMGDFLSNGGPVAEQVLLRAAREGSIFRWYLKMMQSKHSGTFYFTSKGLETHVYYDFNKIVYCIDTEMLGECEAPIRGFEERMRAR